MAAHRTGRGAGGACEEVLLLLSFEFGMPLLLLTERDSRVEALSYWVDAEEDEERRIRRLSYDDALEAFIKVGAGKQTGCLIEHPFISGNWEVGQTGYYRELGISGNWVFQETGYYMKLGIS